MDALFDLDRTEADVVSELAEMAFIKLGEGNSAHVFGDTEHRVVLKVFPPLNVGTAKELAFIKRNLVLRTADQLSLRWENTAIVRWTRQRAKSLVAAFLSHGNVEKRKCASKSCIRGYEACIARGLMTRLPTRVIPNCMSLLSVRGHGRIMKYLVAPERIVLQKRFHDSDVAIDVLRRSCLQNETIEQCSEFIEKTIEYQLEMWQLGLVSTDLSFNIFENSIVLPRGGLQLHDANDVSATLTSARWFIREKEQDVHRLFARLDKGEYPKLLFDTDFGSIAETARKLYNLTPADRRDDLVMHFLELARATLNEDTFQKNWEQHTELSPDLER